MPIVHDVRCPTCGYEIEDLLMPTAPDVIRCFDCGNEAEIVYRARHSAHAQWSDRDACVVYRDADGRIRYPARNDGPTPAGHERIEIRSMAEMHRFERAYGVTNEAAHYDHGDYNGFEREPGYDGRPIAPMRRERDPDDRRGIRP